jgi:hypothetical protein
MTRERRFHLGNLMRRRYAMKRELYGKPEPLIFTCAVQDEASAPLEVLTPPSSSEADVDVGLNAGDGEGEEGHNDGEEPLTRPDDQEPPWYVWPVTKQDTIVWQSLALVCVQAGPLHKI